MTTGKRQAISILHAAAESQWRHAHTHRRQERRRLSIVAQSPSPPRVPLLPPRMRASDARLLIVLDMDETLIHSVFPRHGVHAQLAPHIGVWRPSFVATLPPDDGGGNEQIFVFKRPGLDAFLSELSRGVAADEYEVAVFTAATQAYADVVLNCIDVPHARCPHHQRAQTSLQSAVHGGVYNPPVLTPRTASVLHHRLYRPSTVTHNRVPWVKELGRLGRPLARTVLVDNSALAALANPENVVPVPDFYGDPEDAYLPKLASFLASLRTAPDVRPRLREAFRIDSAAALLGSRKFPAYL